MGWRLIADGERSSAVPGELFSPWKAHMRRLVLIVLDGCTLQTSFSMRPAMHHAVCTPGIRGQRATRSSDKLERQVLIKNSRATAEEFESTAGVTADVNATVNALGAFVLWRSHPFRRYFAYEREALTSISQLINKIVCLPIERCENRLNAN